MRYEKEFKLENGDTVQIQIDLWVDGMFSDNFRYTPMVGIRPKGKRTFTYISDYSDAIKSQVELAKIELWQKLKP